MFNYLGYLALLLPTQGERDASGAQTVLSTPRVPLQRNYFDIQVRLQSSLALSLHLNASHLRRTGEVAVQLLRTRCRASHGQPYLAAATNLIVKR